MGCFQSKKEISDLHPNVFRVVNIDENGLDLCSGQLEITDSDIILYREGRESTVWPLHSLRRYGFEGEIFSFESGRRCETGEGIYAFRCRRAPLLFQTLQQQIQLRNVVHDTIPYPVTRLTPSPQGRQTLQASVVHRSSIDNGQLGNLGAIGNSALSNTATNTGVSTILTHSPRSPSSSDILEVMPLYPRPQSSNSHVTNIYQVRDFKREHNNNQAELGIDTRHMYTNDFNRDLAILRNNLRQEAALNTIRDIEDETHFIENRYVNESAPKPLAKSVVSPTMSNSSEHYAQLSIEQQALSRLYVNIPQNDASAIDNSNKSDTIPTTPLTPKQVDYCNLSVGSKLEACTNAYANLMLSDITDNIKNTRSHVSTSDNNQKFSESDTFTSMSPVEEMEVNYAVLDIDSNKDSQTKISAKLISPESQSYNSSKNNSTASCSSQSRGRIVSQTSIDQPTTSNTSNTLPGTSIGYTTIDFDKTVALTSVAAGAELSMDGCRKKRHNSCSILCGSPSSSEKNKGNN